MAKYYYDMQQVTSVCFEMLNENGMVLFVIGNTEYKGVRMDNVKHLAMAMQDSGFKDLEVTKRAITNKILTPYRTKGGRFTSDAASGRKVYSEEFVIVGKKL